MVVVVCNVDHYFDHLFIFSKRKISINGANMDKIDLLHYGRVDPLL